MEHRPKRGGKRGLRRQSEHRDPVAVVQAFHVRQRLLDVVLQQDSAGEAAAQVIILYELLLINNIISNIIMNITYSYPTYYPI